MTDEEITTIAHRTASKYTHRSDPAFIAYTFLPHTLLDFSRRLLESTTAAERERCAKVCEALGAATNGIYERNQECADAIRRGE